MIFVNLGVVLQSAAPFFLYGFDKMSKVSIVNKALTMLGANRIVSLSDDTREAKTANAVYDQSLRSILSETCWSFATKRALLNRLDEKPVVGWGYYFQRPSDCIEIFETTACSWRPEGEKIWASDPSLGVIYTYLNEDDTFYSPKFVDALACILAANMCYDITNSASRTQELISLYEGEYLPRALHYDASRQGETTVKDDEWINAALGRGSQWLD